PDTIPALASTHDIAASDQGCDQESRDHNDPIPMHSKRPQLKRRGNGWIHRHTSITLFSAESGMVKGSSPLRSRFRSGGIIPDNPDPGACGAPAGRHNQEPLLKPEQAAQYGSQTPLAGPPGLLPVRVAGHEGWFLQQDLPGDHTILAASRRS